MKKTKLLIILFVLLFVGSVLGAVKMLMITKDHEIKNFKLEAVDGFDEAIMNGILIDVDYDIDGFNELNLQYYNGEVVSQEFSKKKEPISPYKEKIYLNKNGLT